MMCACMLGSKQAFWLTFYRVKIKVLLTYCTYSGSVGFYYDSKRQQEFKSVVNLDYLCPVWLTSQPKYTSINN